MTTAAGKRHALIIGGSLGGLFTGVLLRQIGWDVDIFERSPRDLDSRGGGIVLQPDVVEVFRQSGIDLDSGDLGVRSHFRTVFGPDGSIQSKQFAPQTQTSWSFVYTTLRAAFGDAHYHQAMTLTHVEQDLAAGTVTAHFEDGSSETGDLLVGADGGNSAVRAQYWPEARPSYAGYLAWRGLIPEDAMSPATRGMLHGDFSFSTNTGSHILGYLVPGADNDMRPGHRLYNWVWYRLADDEMLARVMTDRDGRARGHAVPEGMLAERWVSHIRHDAQMLLPPPFREVVQATPQPFAQAIRDLASDHMVAGRVVILGDAAAIPRPHTAASTSKAAASALGLAFALKSSPDDIALALERWEPLQVTQGKMLLRRGSQTGDALLFQKYPTVVRS